MYDAGVGAAGGCTVISVDRDGKNLGEWVAISGTLTNCAGGHTPWGTWMTCEETENKANGTTRLKDHGYVFEVWGDGETAHPVPLKALGRYAHEALAIDEERAAHLPVRGRLRPERHVLPLDALRAGTG